MESSFFGKWKNESFSTLLILIVDTLPYKKNIRKMNHIKDIKYIFFA